MSESVLPKEKRLDMLLGDRLTQEDGWVYMTGMQALVRLPIQQRIRDIANNLNTAGFISGYRGSPLGRYDMELWNASSALEQYNVVFKPGVNEDIAATAAWGSQYVGTFPGATVDGVFSIWYGKAPGMDRSMDALRHANMAGTSPLGGSLLLVGDDHGAKSSTLTCYSDFNFVSVGVPLLAPANAQEVLDYGLHGIAMSRHSGLLCGMKLVTDVIEGGGSMYVAPDSPQIQIPEPQDGLSIQTFTPFVEQEHVLYEQRIDQALVYARANGLNQIVRDSREAKLGIVSAGKAHQDLIQALKALGVAESELGNLGLRILKVGMIWPLDDVVVRDFAHGLDTILVVEEKRPLLEDQIRSILYGEPGAPKIIGKFFEGQTYSTNRGEQAFPNSGEIDPATIVRVLSKTAVRVSPDCGVSQPNFPEKPIDGYPAPIRAPSFCAGCPHGRSTQVIEGSRALAGIGCHGMAMMLDPTKTNTISHMGGEGAMWIGQQPFTDEKHVFTNMGDGTYFHSGFLAIRAAVAANLPITYKLLVNGFVSMTGGQAIEGELSIDQIVSELDAEGVKKMALVSDEPEKYSGHEFPKSLTLHERTQLETVQKDFREYNNVSIIIYEQPCATERRRLRKRGQWHDPDKRVFINPTVCEGCGDCGTVSNCMAIEPLETEFGRKRQINQSSCNKDFSCVEGFCPSFVTVEGATLKKRDKGGQLPTLPTIPDPVLPTIDGAWSILVAGIGGTGVVTIGQTLAVAAHADGLYSSNLDVTGLAQKYGAVLSHIKIANSPDQLTSTRIANGEADTLIGADVIVSAGDEVLATLVPGQSRGVVSTHLTPTADFSRDPDWNIDETMLINRLDAAIENDLLKLDSIILAERVLGDAVYANTLLLGAAWQMGGIPVSHEAIMRALELNGVAVEMNRVAFELGRYARHDIDSALELIQENSLATEVSETLEQQIARRMEFLTGHSNEELAQKYLGLVNRVRDCESRFSTETAITEEVAKYYFKVLAHKDQWEVARLYADPMFRQTLKETFDGKLKLSFHLGGWPFGKKIEGSEKIIKRETGEWVMLAFRLLAKFKWVRGSLVDPFRNSPESRAARALISQYENDVETIISQLDTAKLEPARRLASVPNLIRGYGHVRQRKTVEANEFRMKNLAEMLSQPTDNKENLIARAS